VQEVNLENVVGGVNVKIPNISEISGVRRLKRKVDTCALGIAKESPARDSEKFYFFR
jgi:hypothetical protein